jgi:hypothetical protein
MTENLKPTSKVMQISSHFINDGDLVLIAVCQDGSIWELFQNNWDCILEAPRPTAPAIPIPGSWWKKGKEKVQVCKVYLEGPYLKKMISFNDEKGCGFKEDLETFLKLYKSLEAND